jgi:hypothetical protein
MVEFFAADWRQPEIHEQLPLSICSNQKFMNNTLPQTEATKNS